MAEKTEKLEQKEEQPSKLRELVVQTDGTKVVITKLEVTPLELKTICREILDSIV